MSLCSQLSHAHPQQYMRVHSGALQKLPDVSRLAFEGYTIRCFFPIRSPLHTLQGSNSVRCTVCITRVTKRHWILLTRLENNVRRRELWPQLSPLCTRVPSLLSGITTGLAKSSPDYLYLWDRGLRRMPICFKLKHIETFNVLDAVGIESSLLALLVTQLYLRH